MNHLSGIGEPMNKKQVEDLEDLKALIAMLKESDISSFKKGAIEIHFKDVPKPYEKKDKNPAIKEPDFFDVNSWPKDKVSR